MLKIEHASTYNWENAVRSMRHPLKSYHKIDSTFTDGDYILGENDLKLMKRLIKAGADERKFMRQIFVSLDVTAPIYWWKECDQYKIGTVTNSTSTMHTIAKKEFQLSDFSMDGLSAEGRCHLAETIVKLERYRKLYLEDTKDKTYWRDMILLLPCCYNQTRTLTLNYEVLYNMYHARRQHKLTEWREFCEELRSLPYFNLLNSND